MYDSSYTGEQVDAAVAKAGSANVTIEADSAPSQLTLTYTNSLGVTANHIVGDKRVVPNAQSDTNYDTYVLLHIANNRAKWGLVGVDAFVFGVLQLTVSMSDSDATALASVAPQISINGGTATAMAGSAGVFTANLDEGDTYEITFNSLVAAGYQTPAAITGTFSGNISKTATYQTTVYTLFSLVTTKNGNVQGANPQGAGVTVAYTGQTSHVTLTAVNQTVKVPSNLTPTITANTVYGYAKSVSESSGSISLSYATDSYLLNVTKDSTNPDISSTVTRISATGISASGYIDYTGAQTNVEVLVPSGNTPTVVVQSGMPTGYSGDITIDTTLHTIGVYIFIPLFVDLGLPSGKKWAVGNLVKDSQGNYSIGAETDWGTYVSWGNIIGHNEGEGYDFSDANYNGTPGKQVAANIPSNDSAHDIALATLGSPWHLPTKEDCQELYNNTDSEWVADYNGTGVAGRKFMKKSDHSVYVFFPASGLYDGTSLSSRGTRGYYWSSSFDSATIAYNLYFTSSSVTPKSSSFRRKGFAVRPVQ